MCGLGYFPEDARGFDAPPLTPALANLSAVPTQAFPGHTAEDTNAAWSEGRQPASLDAWPADPSGAPVPCYDTVPLEDTADGWPGVCENLDYHSEIADVAGCRETCFHTPSCAVWQWRNGSGVIGSMLSGCSMGTGTRCWGHSNVDPADVFAAQRLRHGSVRVLKDMTAWWVNGLRPMGLNAAVDHAERIRRCRNWCYSNVFCQYWQYTNDHGCWVEDPEENFEAQYPLLIANTYQSPGAVSGTILANLDPPRMVAAGEYIQHYCAAESPSVVAQLSNDLRALPLWASLLGGALLLAVGGVFVACCCCRGRSSAPGKRGINWRGGDSDDESEEENGQALIRPAVSMQSQTVPNLQQAGVRGVVVPQGAAHTMPVLTAPGSYTSLPHATTYEQPATAYAMQPATTYALPHQGQGFATTLHASPGSFPSPYAVE